MAAILRLSGLANEKATTFEPELLLKTEGVRAGSAIAERIAIASELILGRFRRSSIATHNNALASTYRNAKMSDHRSMPRAQSSTELHGNSIGSKYFGGLHEPFREQD